MSLRGTESWPGTLNMETMKGVLVECVAWKWTVLNQHTEITCPNTHTCLQEQLSKPTHLTQIQSHFTLNTLWRRSITLIVRKGERQLRDEETTQSHTASNPDLPDSAHAFPSGHTASFYHAAFATHFRNSFFKSYPGNTLISVWITWTWSTLLAALSQALLPSPPTHTSWCPKCSFYNIHITEILPPCKILWDKSYPRVTQGPPRWSHLPNSLLVSLPNSLHSLCSAKPKSLQIYECHKFSDSVMPWDRNLQPRILPSSFFPPLSQFLHSASSKAPSSIHL